MSYTPNNVFVYTAAFSGCVAGMISNRRITNSSTPSYDDVMRVADAWAQEVDTNWVGTPSQLDVDNIYGISQGEFFNRFPNPKVEPASVVPATYAPVVLAMLAAVASAQNRFAAEGITPPPLPATGATGWVGSKTFDFAGAANHVTLTTDDVKNAALHFIDTLDSGGPYLVTFPVPGGGSTSYPNLVFNDMPDASLTCELGSGGPTEDISQVTAKIISTEPTEFMGEWSNLPAPLGVRVGRLTWDGTRQVTADEIQVSVMHLNVTGLLPLAKFPQPTDDNDSYSMVLINDGGDLNIEYTGEGDRVTLQGGVATVVSFEPTAIKAGVTGALG